jgi:hypothetical protein
MTAGMPVRASQICVCAFVDICALPSYSGAMELWLNTVPRRRSRRGLRPALRPLRRHRSSHSLRPPLHLWLRPTLRSCLRCLIGSQGFQRRSQRGLRAWQFADISTQPPGRNIKSNRGNLIALAISLATPLALGALAIASALAPQRFAGSTAPITLGATAIASALATHRLLASALASQRSGVERPRAWRLA